MTKRKITALLAASAMVMLCACADSSSTSAVPDALNGAVAGSGSHYDTGTSGWSAEQYETGYLNDLMVEVIQEYLGPRVETTESQQEEPPQNQQRSPQQ